MEEAVHIYFSGRVQGVGFRFTARFLASKHNIKGWVKNLIDGRVELFAQAETKKILSFLDALRREFKGYIVDEEIEWVKPQIEEQGFTIRF